MRNDIAHSLEFEITADANKELWSAMSQSLRDACLGLEGLSVAQAPPDLHSLFVDVIVMLEGARQKAKLKRIHMKPEYVAHRIRQALLGSVSAVPTELPT